MTTVATQAAVRTFQIDPAHSDVTFQVRHLLTKVRGRFSSFEGAVEFDAADPVQSSVRFTIQAASIDTNQPMRDAHLRSADFFSVEQFPVLGFVSHAITARGGEQFDVTGTLTIRGVSKTITLPVSYLGAVTDPFGNEKVAFEAETTIDRKDYGLTWNAALETGGLMVGDQVKIAISLQAIGAK